MTNPWRWAQTAVVFLIGMTLWTAVGMAATSQIGPQTRYTPAEIAEAVRNSPLTGSLKQHANQMGQLGFYESSGNAGIYNGSCCTGIFQLNQSNLASFGYTKEQYANLPLQEQVNVWARLTNQGANTAVVRKLQQMQTFDGQPVDGAFIMACIQLGTGNCQKMVESGSCSGFSDINGTTICKMANAMRGNVDTSKQTSDPFGNITGDKQNPDLFTKADLQIQECWSCEAVARVIEVTAQIGPLLINKLGTPAIGIMTTIFGIVFVILIASRLFWISSSTTGWNDLFWLVIRFGFVMMLIGGGTLYTDIVRPYILVPSMAIGGEVGTKFSVIGNAAFKNAPSPGVCRYDRIRASDTEIVQAGEAVINLVCAVHLTINEGIKQAAMPSSKIEAEDSSDRSMMVTAVLAVFSFFVQIAFWLALLMFAFQVVEALIRMGMFVAFAPFLAYAWVYKKTQASFYNAIRSFFYGGVLLVFSGLLSSVMLFIISTGMRQAGNPSTLGIGLDQIGPTVYFLIYSIAAATMAASLVRAAPSFAASVTNYVGGQSQNSIASAGVAGITHGFKTGAAIAGTIAFGAGGVVGKTMGRAVLGGKDQIGLRLSWFKANIGSGPSNSSGPPGPAGKSGLQTIRALSHTP